MDFAFPPADYGRRLALLRERLRLDGRSAYLVTDLANIRYLTGFHGSAGRLLVRAGDALLFADGRYIEAAEAEVPSGLVSVRGVDRARQLQPVSESVKGFEKVFFEAPHMSVELFRALRSELDARIDLVDSGRVVENLRLVKDESEIARSRAAAEISARAFGELPAFLETGVTERQVAIFLENRFVELGAEGPAFPTIVASGENSSRPHAHPSNRRIEAGDLVVVDFGARVDGYHADITRTIWFGPLREDRQRLHRAVVAANAAGVAAVRPGVTHADVYRACRAVLAEHGYDEAPAHPFGHNVGLFIHELPFLSDDGDQPLEAGQIITVEPGVYHQGLGGVRIEDMVLVRPGGQERISHLPVQTA